MAYFFSEDTNIDIVDGPNDQEVSYLILFSDVQSQSKEKRILKKLVCYEWKKTSNNDLKLTWAHYAVVHCKSLKNLIERISFRLRWNSSQWSSCWFNQDAPKYRCLLTTSHIVVLARQSTQQLSTFNS